MNVFIAGVANSGKTTLFNGLTGQNERVGNWHGVTTEPKSHRVRGMNAVVTDLPGSYLNGDYTLEQASLMHLLKGADAILVVAEAASLRRSLEVVNRLAVFNVPIALVINMYAELYARGGRIDLLRLRQLTGLNVIIAEVNTKRGVSAVKALIGELLKVKSVVVKRFLPLEVCRQCVKAGEKGRLLPLDKLLLQKKVFYPLFLLVTVLFLYLAFGKYGPGSFAAALIDQLFNCAVNRPIGLLLSALGASELTCRLIIEGVLGSIGCVLQFLPRLLMITLFTALLDESGVMARIAFVADGLFCKMGLTGRSVFTLLTGYGCTAVACQCSGGLEDERAQHRVVRALAFVPCSAKMPVFAYILSLIGARHSFLILIAAFVGGMACALLFCFIQEMLFLSKQGGLIIELAPYRVPKIKSLAKALQKFAKEFIIKTGTVIAITSAFLWLLANLSWKPAGGLTLAVEGRVSLLQSLAIVITPLFRPIGITDWRVVVAIVSGVAAKEGVVSSLAALKVSTLALKEGVSLLAFTAIYPPCIAATACIAKQTGIKNAAFVLIFQTVLAYLICFAVFNLGIAAVLPISAAICALAAYKRIKNRVFGNGISCKNLFRTKKRP